MYETFVLYPMNTHGYICPSGSSSAQWVSPLVRLIAFWRALAIDRIFNRWDSVAIQIIAVVGKELANHPTYSVVTTGHSLGGSLAALGAVTLQQNFETT
jgi:predicted lipase